MRSFIIILWIDLKKELEWGNIRRSIKSSLRCMSSKRLMCISNLCKNKHCRCKSIRLKTYKEIMNSIKLNFKRISLRLKFKYNSSGFRWWSQDFRKIRRSRLKLGKILLNRLRLSKIHHNNLDKIHPNKQDKINHNNEIINRSKI